MSEDHDYQPEVIGTPAPAQPTAPVEDTAAAERDRQKLAAFFPKPLQVLDLTLRPYTANTDALLELARFPLRKRLNDMAKEIGPADDEQVKQWRDEMAVFFGLASALYVHSAPVVEVEAAAWSPALYWKNLSAFLSRYSKAEILSALPVVGELLEPARIARDWKTQPQGVGKLPPPGFYPPAGSPSMSSESAGKPDGASQ